MQKKLYGLLTAVLCFLMVGCSFNSNSTYNKEKDRDYKKIKSVNGMRFEVPDAYLEDADSIMDLTSLETLESDETYYYDTLSTSYFLFNYEQFFISANSVVKDIDLEDVDTIDDLQDMLDDSDTDQFELGKKFIKSEEDDVIKIITDVTAEMELSNDLSEDFIGKIALVQEDDRCSILFIGVLEDIKGKETDKIINYVAKSLVADEFDENVEADEVVPIETEVPTEEPITETEAPTNTETPNNVAKPSVDTLSSDVYSFQLQIDGEVYQFPMTYNELLAYGWVYKNDDTKTIKPDQYSVAEVFKKGDLQLYCSLINLGMNVEPISKCYVGGISLDNYQIGDSNASILLPGGIDFKSASKEDIIAAYGDPSDLYEGDSFTTLTYTLDYYQDYKIQIDNETKHIYSIDIKNFVLPEGSTSAETEVSSEVPEIVSKYEAPTSLGNDFTKFIVEYDGDLYKLPAPVSEFVKNGWKIATDSSEASVKAGGSGWVTITKNNQKLKVIAKNYADNATTINNCFITKVKAGVNSTNLPLTVQKGITVGMSQKNLEKALKGVDFEKDGESSFIYYTIEGADSSLDNVEISVYKETGKVQSIEVSYLPKVDNLFK